MSRFEDIYSRKIIPSYLTPLFWQRGDEEGIIREEIKQMNENGIGSFIVEPRPHPDFMGSAWWRDLDITLDEAEKRNMKVWLFDDSGFPSGYAAGKIRDHHPEYLKVYLDERHIDASGPLKGSSFIIKAWLDSDERVIAVIAARRVDGIDEIEEKSIIDLTERICDGILYWDVPEGEWRIFMFIRTRNGGEEATRNHLNPLEAEPVKAFIDYIYEEYYRRYASAFGKTIAGFFYDEPRFGNVETYEASLGNFDMVMPLYDNLSKHKMVLPYSDKLLGYLNEAWNGDFKLYLPCLWYNAGSTTADVRYTYMDVVSRLYGENFTQQIGDWCRKHCVKLIGHVIEDNGAHARLGYGSGHFFRSIKGQDHSGLDIVVCQVLPEHSSGKFTTQCGLLDADFFYWGLTKMASSAGHIDPKKDGITVCEVFGAYGWQEGLKLMKWLTDHICVRGVNFIIPHAFSPKYPDLDCPPHFYARGANPQWRYFHIWSGYANRICHLLTGGKHVAPVAVIYHAEAEWSGEYMPFEKVVKTLALRQIDCDVIPIDAIVGKEALKVERGSLIIHNECYRAVIIPFAERLPVEFLEQLAVLAENEIYIIFIDNYTAASSQRSETFSDIIERLKSAAFSQVCNLDTLIERLKSLKIYDIEVSTYEKNLRYYHYENEHEQIYFFTNESIRNSIYTEVGFKTESIPMMYDAMEDKIYKPQYRKTNGMIYTDLSLSPYESIFVVFNRCNKERNLPTKFKNFTGKGRINIELTEPWDIYLADVKEYPCFTKKANICCLCNISVPGLFPEFSGIIRYENRFVYDEIDTEQKIFLDLGEVYETAEVWLNEKPVGVRICPPYILDVTEFIAIGHNTIRIDVTNTLAKKHGCNILDRTMPQEPSGLIGPVRIVTKI